MIREEGFEDEVGEEIGEEGLEMSDCAMRYAKGGLN